MNEYEPAMGEKERQALTIIKKYMWIAGGAGLIPIPIVDIVAVSGSQMKMLSDISAIYDIPFEESRGKALVGSLMGYVVPHALSYGLIGSLWKAIPVVGPVISAPSMALFSAASAWALGKVFVQHFESGGTFLDFDPDRVRQHFKAQFDEGRKMAAEPRVEGQG